MVSGCEKADIALVIDSSGSIQEGGNNWARMKTFTQELVNRLDISVTRVRVGAVQYGGNANVEFNLNTYSKKSDIVDHLGTMAFLGTKTYTGLGLRYMQNEIFQQSSGDRDDVPNIGIVITDGKSNINEEETKKEADLAKEQGTKIITIGISAKTSISELMDIASNNQSLFIVNNFEVLMQQLDNIVNTICDNPTIELPKG